MKKTLFPALFFGALFCILTSSCSRAARKALEPKMPSENIVSDSLHYDDFQGISVAQGIVVEVIPEVRKENILVKGPENVVEALRITNKEGILYMEVYGPKEFKYTSENQRLHVVVSEPGLTSFEAMANASIHVADTLKTADRITACAYSNSSIRFDAIQTQELDLESFTNSTLKAFVDVEFCKADAYTNSDITLSGSASRLNLNAVSSAKIQTVDMEAETAEASATDQALIKSAIPFDSKYEQNGGKIVSD